MSYTVLACAAVAVVCLLDWFGFRTRLLGRRVFWVSYAIIICFQLLMNGLLTGLRIVRYNGDQIAGGSTPVEGTPAFLGDGRIVYAPFEDLLFGFAMVLLTLMLWIYWGRRGIQRLPMAGPPRLGERGKRDAQSSG